MTPMSLRTRRSAALLSSLMLLAVACTSTPGVATPAPTTGGVATPGATTGGEATPGATTGGEATPEATTGGEATPEPTTGGEATTPPETGGTLRVYCCATDPRSLQPQAASGSDEISILSATARGLLYYDTEGNIVPALATDMPEISEDGLTYTFTLGENSYSDGTPIVAGDFVRAARTLADPRNAFDYGYEACWIAGVDAVLGTDFGCSEGDTPYLDAEAGTFDDATIEGLLDEIGVTAPDDSTVVFELKTP